MININLHIININLHIININLQKKSVISYRPIYKQIPMYNAVILSLVLKLIFALFLINNETISLLPFSAALKL